MTISDGGMLAIAFLEASASLILFVLFLLLYRSSRRPFLRLWLGGWALFTAQGAIQLLSYGRGGGPTILFLKLQLCLLAGLLFAAAILHYVDRSRWVSVLWPVGALGVLLVGLRTVWAPSSSTLQWSVDIFQSVLLLSAGWVLWRFVQGRSGFGGALLGAALLLHAIHGLDHSQWSTQAGYLLRAAFDGLLGVAMGIAMVVLVLESAHARTELLNEKLRRLTLITARATQTFKVDEVLGEALEHLVESLGASHGLVRLLDGEGDSAALVLRAAVGFNDTFTQQRARIPADQPWARRVLERNEPFLAYANAADPEIRNLMDAEKLSALVLLRLPGKEGALGLLGVGSAAPHQFHDDEVAFLVNVANLLGLTVQNVWLFEQIVRGQREWKYTFDSISDPVLVHDDNGIVLRVNRAVSERLGVEPAALVGRPISGIFRRVAPPTGGPGCPYCEGVAGHGDEEDEYLGGFLLASNSDFHDESGRRAGTVHVLKDVSERKKAEEMYRNLFENVQEGVFISTPEGRFLDFNDAFLRILGFRNRDELKKVDIGSTLYVNAADRERLKKLLRDHGSVTNYEFQMRRPDGEIVTLCESSFATRDASGAITAYQGFVLDVTERKRAEMELRRRNRELMVLNSIGQTLTQSQELEELLHRALRQIVELFELDLSAIYLLEEKTRLLRRQAEVGFHSEYARAFPPVEIPAELLQHLRQVHATVLPGQSLPLPDTFQDLVQKEAIAVSHVVVLWSKDRIMGALTTACREEREFSAAELNLLGAVGNQVAVTIERALLHEETRRAYEHLRHTQEQLLQSEKMAAVGQLISGVAHELNNPLTAILGYGQLLAGSSHVTPRGAQYVDKLYRQAQRTQRIVQNLLSFARQRKPERLPVRLNQILDDTLNLREYDLKLNNVRVHRDFQPVLPPTTGDAHQLQQVFLNILNNAVDVVVERPGPRDIWVRTHGQNGHLFIEFTDSGPGVDDPLRVFDPFYTTKPVGKGTGLGLSICYGIVKEHGGEIAVENSAEPGRGATFRIRLPLSPVSLLQPAAPNAPEEGSIGGIVLLVDDEESLLDLEKEILRTKCAKVLTAQSGRDAIAVLQRETVDAVVTDLKMPGEVSGQDLYRWIVRHRPQLAPRVVFTMSDARTDDVRALQEESNTPFVQKPFQVEEFVGVIRKIVCQGLPAEVSR